MHPDLNFLTDIATQAGTILKEMHRKQIEVHHKSKADLVTAADKASENYLISEIEKYFPNHSIVSEESGLHQKSQEHQWFIDPLDGTLNYAHGMPFFSVSVAYALEGELQIGAIYDPLIGEMFTAQRGKGAYINNQQIHVSGVTQLIDSLLVTGFRHHLLDTGFSNMDNFLRFSRLTQGVRRLGSAALDMAYIAAGRLDGYWENSINQWDIAAGVLMVQEAGGVVTKLYGEPDVLSEPVNLLAANPAIHSKMLEILLNKRD